MRPVLQTSCEEKGFLLHPRRREVPSDLCSGDGCEAVLELGGAAEEGVAGGAGGVAGQGGGGQDE